MPSTTKELLSKMRTALPKVEALPEPARTIHVFPDKAPEAAGKGSRAPKLSVSLYQHDIDRLDVIKDFMKAQGFRNLSDSEALRLACRKVEVDGSLVEVYKAMQLEDGRRVAK